MVQPINISIIILNCCWLVMKKPEMISLRLLWTTEFETMAKSFRYQTKWRTLNIIIWPKVGRSMSMQRKCSRMCYALWLMQYVLHINVCHLIFQTKRYRMSHVFLFTFSLIWNCIIVNWPRVSLGKIIATF